MRQIILVIIFFINLQTVFSQDCPIKNEKQIIQKHKIKVISTKVNGLKEHKSLEVSRFEFNEKGDILREKSYKLFDVILYSEEYKYLYDSKGKLYQKNEISTNHPKNEKDSSLVGKKGLKPKESKWIYEYNNEGQLIKELHYLKADDISPSLSTEYKYNSEGNKIFAKYQHLKFPEQMSFNNKVEEYQFDSLNRLVETKMNWTTSDVSSVEKTIYNSEGNKTYWSRIHNHGIGDIAKYEYKDGKNISEEKYRLNQTDWHRKTVYEYSTTGLLIREKTKRNTGQESIKSFDYNEKGLLKTEYKYGKTGKKTYSFVTTYEYF